eukprot:scaffold8789_cov186-Skeletonema_marinoi.AAC.3
MSDSGGGVSSDCVAIASIYDDDVASSDFLRIVLLMRWHRKSEEANSSSRTRIDRVMMPLLFATTVKHKMTD